MAWLGKQKTTYWVDRSGNRVKKGTKGARKVTVKSAKWYGCWKENGKPVRVPLATDKLAAQAMLADLIRQRERGEAKLVHPYKEHLDRPLSEHLDDYLAVVRSLNRSKEHQKELERILRQFIKVGGVKQLRDVTPDRVTRYLTHLKSGPTTRNIHRRLIVMLMNWLESVGRIDRNPITTRNVRPAKNIQKRLRRAMTADEIQRLLAAVREYPLRAASINRGGRNAKKKPQDRPAKLKPDTVARLTQRGRERWLLYRLAVLTGLRRGELSRLRVSHLEFDQQPARINLPAHLTKNGKPARIVLVPSLAADLKQWTIDTGKRPTEPVVTVPGRCNLHKLHKAHLTLAGIPYELDGRFADFHSLRMAANVVLRKAGIPAKERQLFLRHGKLELTTETYDDDHATEMAEVVKALADSNL